MFARTLQQWLIRGVRRVQGDHLSDRQARFAAREPLNGIPGTYIAFSLNGEVEPAASALEETLDHFRLAETDRQLVAGHARLCDNELRCADTVAVANPDIILQQPLRREVLPECAPGQFRIRQFATPKVVVLRRVRVHGFFQSAVNGQIRLLVALDVVTRDVHAVGHRRLEDGSLDTASTPLHLTRSSDTDRHNLHLDSCEGPKTTSTDPASTAFPTRTRTRGGPVERVVRPRLH